MKTVRFSQVVEAAGRPEVHSLWVAPEKDADFQRARKSHRVMTLASNRGKTDAGVVGYDAEAKSSEYLIFPKSLARFEGAQVVGIKFELVEQPKTEAAQLSPWTNNKGASKGKRKTRPTKKIAPFKLPKKDEPRVEKEDRKEEEPRQSPATTHRKDSALVREVRAALKELETGKSVAAYRRLERAIR